MKILIDIRSLIGNAVSGIPEYTRLLIEHFHKIRPDYEYIFFANSLRKPLSANALPQKARFVNWHIPNKVLDFSMRFLGQPKIDVFYKSDVIFSPHFNSLAVRSAPRVVTFHDLSFVRSPEFYSFRKRSWHFLEGPKQQAQAATKIIAISNATKSDLINFYKIPDEKISVVYSGVNPFFFEKISEEKLRAFRDARGLNQPFLLFVGTLEPRKNITAVIQLLNILKQKKAFSNLKLVIVGARGWLYDKIFLEAGRSQFKKDIVFYGSVSFEELRNLYHLARVFVYPSFFEGFGFPPLEAQACGSPVIASKNGSLPEILKNSALFINPHNVDELVSATEKILTDFFMREALIEKGLENVKRFTWENTARETLSILEKCCAEKK